MRHAIYERLLRISGSPVFWLIWVAALLVPGELLLAGLNTGAAFLKIGTGARPSALGGAYTAVADDVNALYYNPGGLARLPKREFGATHAEWLVDTKFDFLGYAHPTRLGTFALGFTRLAAGTQEGRGPDRRPAAGFEASDTAYTLGYSRGLGGRRLGWLGAGKTSAGANLKLLESRIAGYSAGTLALDLGVLHALDSRPLTLGASVLNIGRGLRFLEQTDPLPLTFAVGSAYRLGGALNLALDVRHEVYDRRTDIGIGTEYALLPAFALRMGYASQGAGPGGTGGGLGALAGLGGGFGVKLKDYRADYTFTPFGDLGNAQRISLGARF